MKAVTNNGYIIAVGENVSGEEISQERYDGIMAALSNMPEREAGYGYRLKTDLTWEKYEIPAPDPDPDVDDTEAVEILLGGET